MSDKIQIGRIVKAQLATFRGYGIRSTLFDLLTFIVVPAVLGLATGLWAPKVFNVGSVLSGITVFTGLLVALLVNVFNFSVKIKRDEKVPLQHVLVVTVNELMANASWAVLVGLTLTVLASAASATLPPSCPLNSIWVGVLTGVVAHLVLIVLVVLSRIWTAHEAIKTLPPKND